MQTILLNQTTASAPWRVGYARAAPTVGRTPMSSDSTALSGRSKDHDMPGVSSLAARWRARSDRRFVAHDQRCARRGRRQDRGSRSSAQLRSSFPPGRRRVMRLACPGQTCSLGLRWTGDGTFGDQTRGPSGIPGPTNSQRREPRTSWDVHSSQGRSCRPQLALRRRRGFTDWRSP